jgi:pyruvate/2-oxoglutarate dehydrogenase complex dihydrolipoamide dehydrogenase (E3) component
MSDSEKFDTVVLGSGTGGKLVAWTMAKEGRRTAVVERKFMGGSCANIACLPSKNIIHSAKVASLLKRHQEFGIETDTVAVNMAGVYARKRTMVDEIVKVHLDRYHAAGDDLILGDGRGRTTSARLFRFLVSPEAGWITGQIIQAAGGLR